MRKTILKAALLSVAAAFALPALAQTGADAQAQRDDVAKVRIDGGEWQDATLGPDAGIDYWRQWRFAWRAALSGISGIAAPALFPAPSCCSCLFLLFLPLPVAPGPSPGGDAPKK